MDWLLYSAVAVAAVGIFRLGCGAALDRLFQHRWVASARFEPRDLWVGVFWRVSRSRTVTVFEAYVCVVPCLPLHVAAWRNKHGPV